MTARVRCWPQWFDPCHSSMRSCTTARYLEQRYSGNFPGQAPGQQLKQHLQFGGHMAALPHRWQLLLLNSASISPAPTHPPCQSCTHRWLLWPSRPAALPVPAKAGRRQVSMRQTALWQPIQWHHLHCHAQLSSQAAAATCQPDGVGCTARGQAALWLCALQQLGQVEVFTGSEAGSGG